MAPRDFGCWAKSLRGQLFAVFSNSGKIFLVLKANSLFFSLKSCNYNFRRISVIIINATGLDLVIIIIGVGKGREWYTMQEIV